MHPTEFGKYRIIKLLPLGGMGRVYLALDPELQTRIALKLIDSGPDPDRQEIVEAERRGAILQARLCGLDQRIVRIIGYGDHDGFFFIEMEFVDGQDLSELLSKAPLGVPFAARIGRDLCDVLHHAHTFSAEIEGQQYRGIVHGDIKPRNIRITPDGQVKVLDFGIAKALSLTRKFTTNQFGSSQYSSPERLNTGEVDIESDLWSVAVVLFEIVTGKPYFQGDSSPRLEHAIRNYSAVRPLPDTFPPAFRAILRKALAVRPEHRYGSAQAFAADLNAFLENQPTVAESEPAVEEDDEATRRIVASGVDDATRRTVPGATPFPSVPAGAKAVPFREAKPKKTLTPRQRQIRFFTLLGLGMLFGLLVFNEVTVWRSGSELAREVESERLKDMDVAWQRMETLQKTSFVPFVLSGPRNSILGRLVSEGDAVVNEYRRADAPSVSENDWVRAQSAYAKVLQIDPRNNSIRGRMYVCEGHILRIRGVARGNSKMLNEARAKFDQAAELMPRSPDPYIGLARLYASLRDVERVKDAIEAADKRGHETGRRERAQLADAYRDRGERLVKDALRAAGLPEEGDLLSRSEKDLHQAEELYREILPYGNSTVSLRRVLENLDVVRGRRDATKDSIWPWR